MNTAEVTAVRVNDFKYRFTDQPGGWFGHPHQSRYGLV
jgi:hypothetical protein